MLAGKGVIHVRAHTPPAAPDRPRRHRFRHVRAGVLARRTRRRPARSARPRPVRPIAAAGRQRDHAAPRLHVPGGRARRPAGPRHRVRLPGGSGRPGHVPAAGRRLDPRRRTRRSRRSAACRRSASTRAGAPQPPTASSRTRASTAPGARRPGARGSRARRSSAGGCGSATRPAPGPGSPDPAMGVFQHEAACVDPIGQYVFLSEDVNGGGLYRYTPEVVSRPDDRRPRDRVRRRRRAR